MLCTLRLVHVEPLDHIMLEHLSTHRRVGFRNCIDIEDVKSVILMRHAAQGSLLHGFKGK